MSPPVAATISIRNALAMLDGPKREIADGVANDSYVFWLGSGISREKMPDLRDLAKRVLVTLQGRIDQADANCRYRKALATVVGVAGPSAAEWARIDDAVNPEHWPDFDALAGRLVNSYARMLNITVDNEEADFLLWDVLDAARVYSDATVGPDAEHLCLAALAIEGVASELPTANWDPLIERAVATLAGSLPILRVVVHPEDLRVGRRRANLYKFHGCAEAARANPARFRSLLVARENQINRWPATNAVMGGNLLQLIVTKPTLMLGLSAQDSNIQGLFAEAQARMPWRWPAHPPAYAFAENALGGGQEGLLQNVYHLDYSVANRPQMEAEALVQAYAKPLLLALLLYVLTTKLKVLVDHRLPGLAPADRQKLHDGLVAARNLMASGLTPRADAVLELLQHVGRTLVMLREGAVPGPAAGMYSPLSIQPADQMLGDPALAASGLCQFAVASSLIGLGLDRGLWTATKADTTDPASGAIILIGRSGPAKIYFAATPQAAIQLGTNGLMAANDDGIIVHSQENPPAMPRYPRRALGRTVLAALRQVSIDELVAGGSEVEDMLDRFRNAVAL